MIVIVLCNIRYVTEKVILWKVYECGSCFISSWNMVIWVTIILKRTCVDIDRCFTTFAVVDIQSDQNELHTSVDIDLIAGLEINARKLAKWEWFW